MAHETTDAYWRRMEQAEADGVNRADKRLRFFARREGDALMCAICDGAGVVIRSGNAYRPSEPVKCRRCGGDGLEPTL